MLDVRLSRRHFLKLLATAPAILVIDSTGVQGHGHPLLKVESGRVLLEHSTYTVSRLRRYVLVADASMVVEPAFLGVIWGRARVPSLAVMDAWGRFSISLVYSYNNEVNWDAVKGALEAAARLAPHALVTAGLIAAQDYGSAASYVMANANSIIDGIASLLNSLNEILKAKYCLMLVASQAQSKKSVVLDQKCYEHLAIFF